MYTYIMCEIYLRHEYCNLSLILLFRTCFVVLFYVHVNERLVILPIFSHIIKFSKVTQQDYNATCRSHCKSRTLCDQIYAKVHLVTPISKVHLVTPVVCRLAEITSTGQMGQKFLRS